MGYLAIEKYVDNEKTMYLMSLAYISHFINYVKYYEYDALINQTK